MQHISQIVAPENIDLKNTWFTPDLEKDPRKALTHMPRVTPETNINIITLSKTVQQVPKSPVSKGASVSEVIKRPGSEVV